MRSFWAIALLASCLALLGARAQQGGDVTSVISKAQFDQLLKHRNDSACPARGFYTYDAFAAAVRSFPAFGTTGDRDTRLREVAAFLAQTSHETTEGGVLDQMGPTRGDTATWRSRTGRETTVIANLDGRALRAKNITVEVQFKSRNAVAKEPVLSFRTALWFWMTPQSPKPSSHDVITGRWRPSPADSAAGRVPGYGLITNIINGGEECGKGPNTAVEDRIGFYKKYSDAMKVGYGNNLDCYNQKPYAMHVR